LLTTTDGEFSPEANPYDATADEGEAIASGAIAATTTTSIASRRERRLWRRAFTA
jgi:hypothetical protein